MSPELSTVDEADKRDQKTNFSLIIQCSMRSTNPANLAKIGPVDVGTTGLNKDD